MRIFVKVKSNAKKVYIEKVDSTHFVVAIKEQPEKGRANQAVTKALEEYFHAPVRLVSGFTSRQKVFIMKELI